MLTISQDLIAAYTALHKADEQDLLDAAKATYRNTTLSYDARDCAMISIKREASERIYMGDPTALTPLLHDVIACADEFFRPWKQLNSLNKSYYKISKQSVSQEQYCFTLRQPPQ